MNSKGDKFLDLLDLVKLPTPAPTPVPEPERAPKVPSARPGPAWTGRDDPRPTHRHTGPDPSATEPCVQCGREPDECVCVDVDAHMLTEDAEGGFDWGFEDDIPPGEEDTSAEDD